MAYNVKYRGLILLCDSLDEVDRIADRLEENKSGRHGNSSIKDVVARMAEGGQKVLRILLETEPPITSSLLCKRMNLDISKLSGKLSAVSIPIKQAGFKPVVIRTNGHYALDPDAVEDVRQGLGMK